jgi:hypothetical protein
MNDATNHPTSPRHRPLLALVCLLAGTVLVASGCKNPKKKAKDLFKQTIEDCRTTESTFYEADLMAGDETVEVLSQTCKEEMGKITVNKGIEASLDVGPYTWKAGVQQSTGIWVLKGVDWESFQTARRRLDSSEPGEKGLKRAADLLADAQEEFPKSSWLRLKRLETLLKIRAKTRSSEGEDAHKLGEDARDYFSETLSWANSNSKPAVAAQARLQAIDHLKTFARSMQNAKDSLGSQDEHFEKTIEQAEKEGDEEEAEEYRKELEQLREKRPDKKKTYNNLIEQARTSICKQTNEFDTEGIEDSSLKDRIGSADEGIDCQKLLDGE